jgi:hypothetical protein
MGQGLPTEAIAKVRVGKGVENNISEQQVTLGIFKWLDNLGSVPIR